MLTHTHTHVRQTKTLSKAAKRTQLHTQIKAGTAVRVSGVTLLELALTFQERLRLLRHALERNKMAPPWCGKLIITA